MIKKLFVTVLLMALMAVSFSACDKKDPVSSQSALLSEGPIISSTETSVSVSTETSVSASASASTETSISEDVSGSGEIEPQAKEGLDFQVLITNMCKADIGMVSILDPYEGEQHNVGELPDGQVLTFSFTDWPADVTDFNVAFYNKSGELVSSSTVDITGVKTMVTIMLTGEGNIEKVKSDIN